MSGFYFAHRLTDEIGLSFAVVYIPEERSANIANVWMLNVGDWIQRERGDGMNDLNFYWRMGDYALQAVPKCLARYNKDDENETIELVKYYQYQGKECLYTIGYFYYNEHEPCWELNFVGDRFKELLETDVVAVFKMLKAAYDVLTEWMEGREVTE